MRLRRKVDVLVFNPPYVPTEDDEADSAQTRRGIAGSWAGGLHGMALTDILLSQINVSPLSFRLIPATKTIIGPALAFRPVLSCGNQAEQRA
jgi:release factor glutamine methyltransferase